jgi:hypothetical protein
MRILKTLLPVAFMLSGAPAAAQTFQPAVVSTKLPPLEALWHVRVALNVAALGCRDADERVTVASYNALIRNQPAVLNAANNAVTARYRAQYGAAGENIRERDMTKLYNYFAQPTAQAEFCEVAKSTLAQIGSVSARDLPAFAVAALPDLEAPFWPGERRATDIAAREPAPTLALSATVPVSPGLPMRRRR